MASSASKTDAFVTKVQTLIRDGRVYENITDFVTQIALLMVKDQDKALDLVSQMAELARTKPPRRKSTKEYLRLLAKTLDDFQIVSPSWISRNVSYVPEPKKKPVQDYTPGKVVVDIRTLENPAFPKQVHVLHTREEENESMDIGSDPEIILGSPLVSPVKLKHSPAKVPPVVENPTTQPLAPTCTATSSETSTVSALDNQVKVPGAVSAGHPVKVHGSDTVNNTTKVHRSDTVIKRTKGAPGAVSAGYPLKERKGDRSGHSGDKQSKKRNPGAVSAGYTRDSSAEDLLVKVKQLQSSKRDTQRKVEVKQSSKRAKVAGTIAATQEVLKKAKKHKRNAECYIPHCKEGGRAYPKVHAWNHHIPGIFDTRLPDEHSLVNIQRLQALRQACKWLWGEDDLSRLVRLVEVQEIITESQGYVSQESMDMMSTFAQFHGLELPHKLTIAPVNCVPALLHWKCLEVISSLLQPAQHDLWRELYPKPTEDQLTKPVAEDDPIPRPAPPPAPPAFDSHFHLDRLQQYARLEGADVQTTVNAGEVDPDRRVQVVGAVANFCDPETYPGARQLASFPSELLIAIGIHPKHASRSSRRRAADLESMKQLLEDPRVCAVGEIGLDHSVRDSDWPAQNELIRKILPLIRPHQVVILHCRGMADDCGSEAHFLLLHLLRTLPTTQRIHMHCYSGEDFVTNKWTTKFPEICFSFNRGIASFNSSQLQALVSLPDHRLLLETDAPYFPRGRRPFSAPNELYDVAELLAMHRRTTVEHILQLTWDNARRLYHA